MNTHDTASRFGFTLFELLVTMMIVAVFVTLGVVSLGSFGDSQSLKSAQSQIHSLFRVARGHAIMSGSEARLIINFDENDPDRFLRFIGIIVRDETDSTKWRTKSKGAYLPEGIYVVPQNKAGFVSFLKWDSPMAVGSDQKSEYKRANSDGALDGCVMRIEYPKLSSMSVDLTAPEWIVYQFAADGKLSAADIGAFAGGLAPVSSHVSLLEGSFDSAGKLVFEGNENVVGVRVRQNGYIFSVTDSSAL